MKAKHSTILVAVVLWSHLYGQDSLWRPIKIDENLTVSIPKKIEQIDTTLGRGNTKLGFRILKAETQVSTLGVTVTPKGTNINVDDEESLKSALDGIAKGTCDQARQNGFICKMKDSTLDDLPCKKFEFFSAGIKDPIIYNYTFLVNDKIYMFTIAHLKVNQDRTKLIQESKKFLNSVHFTKTIKEKKFSTRAESTGYRIGYYLIPSIFAIGFIIYIVIRLTSSYKS